MRNLVVVLGDQLDGESAAFDGFDARQDAILQMEVRQEATYVPQHKKRIAYFFAAMRHFREAQKKRGRSVQYVQLDDPENTGTLAGELLRWARGLGPRKIVMIEPGDFRVKQSIEALGLEIDMRVDRHFLCSIANFAAFTRDHKRPILETFYRWMRKRHGILMKDGKPLGGSWNFDADNRNSFGKKGAPLIPPLPRFKPDRITKEVLALVEEEFADSPGSLDGFALPVTRDDALAALNDFVMHRLPDFGRYQDAMHTGQPFLYHSVLSGPLNLHLLDPREVLEAALDNPANAPLNAVEGFVRQILGWREFVRGIYWQRMPDYARMNALNADLPMPRFFWTGETEMRCLKEAIGHTIDHAYAHHIERLMVLGLFAMLLGVRPFDVHCWHMSMFWDAIDWVSLPNTLGMSQHGDGGIVGTKPYAASGNYISRMSDHCAHCRFDPHAATGPQACPFTTLYWDFLARHEDKFARNPRMTHAYSNLARKDPAQLREIRKMAKALRAQLTAEAFFPER